MPKPPKQKQKPLLLLRNVRYPAYQLWAYAGCNNVDGNTKNSETVLKISILYTMAWLRERFREHEIPENLIYPPADEYDKAELSHFKDVHIKHGYQLDILWLKEEKIWSLQLTEPDLGSTPGAKKQSRLPVPGRIIETNVSYQTTDDGVLCGFQTIVSEPEGTDVPCEVYRLGFIKHLKRDPLVGLEQIWSLEETPRYIKTSSDVKSFSKKLKRKERTLPIVIFSEYLPTNKNENSDDTVAKINKVSAVVNNAANILPEIDKIINTSLTNRSYSEYINIEICNDKKMPVEQNNPYLPADINEIAHYRMGYAHFFVVSSVIRRELSRVIKCDIPNGGAVLIPSPQTDEDTVIFTYDKIREEEFLQELSEIVQNYSREKTFDLSMCCFLPKAQKIYNERLFASLHNTEDLKKFYANEFERIKDVHNKYIAEVTSKERSETRKLIQKLGKLSEQCNAAQQREKGLQEKLASGEAEINELTGRLQLLRTRPDKLSGVLEWVKQVYGDRLVILDRVQSMMRDVSDKDIDVRLLCDCMEFLANEYSDMLNGIIDESELGRRCARNYDRPFEVVPNNERLINSYPDEYIVSYTRNGITTNESLKLHLKVGVDSKRLIRVYFFFDKDLRKIVIGAMPKHLSTLTYK